MTIESTLLLAGGVAALSVVMLSLGYRQQSTSQSRQKTLVRRLEDVGLPSTALAERRRNPLLVFADRFDHSRGAARMRQALERADLDLRPSVALAIVGALAFSYYMGLFLAFALRPWLHVGLAVLGAGVTALAYLRSRQGAYLRALSAQMPAVSMLMSNSLRAGLSVYRAIIEVEEKTPRPAGNEFRRVHHEIDLGASVDVALRGLATRMPTEEIGLLVTTIVIQRGAGGDLARALAVMSVAVAARYRLRNEVDTLTAESRFTGVVIVILPFVIMVMLDRVMPGIVTIFLNSPLGLIITFIVMVIMGGALILVQRIGNIQV